MKIKKYTAGTEQEAIEMVKNELGLDALVLNIKTIQPKGFMSIFRKTTVEVTAAYEEKIKPVQSKDSKKILEKEILEMPKLENQSNLNNVNTSVETDNLEKQKIISQQVKINMLEKELDNKESLLEKAASLLAASTYKRESYQKRRYENNMLQIFYDALIGQGVTDEIAQNLLQDVENLADQTDLAVIVKVVYNNIINILGEPVSLDGDFSGDVYFFLGPTGVGKTTTIAKLSSRFVLNANAKVGLITADTYRIAAVEQLKTYAQILGIDIGIVYNANDLKEVLPKMQSFSDVVLIDTAGRSHKNTDAIKELCDLLSVVPDAQKFLVLSLTTKYEDLLSIVKAYSEITDFKIIFTKADETLCFGSILNICYITNKNISYITNGQNVPDDIRIIKPEQIAKSLLGLGGGMSG